MVFQCRRLAVAIVELAVVIILQHPCIAVGGPGQQRRATPGRQRHAEWKLVGRRHHCEPCIRTARARVIHAKPLIIDRNRNDAHRKLRERLLCEDVTGVLQPDLIIGLEQQARDQAQGALIA